MQPQQFTIRKQDGQYCLIAKDGKKLGCHDTRGEAEAQERAIKAAEHKKTVKLNIKKKDGRFLLIDDDDKEIGDFETRKDAEDKAESLMSSEPTEVVLAFEKEDDDKEPSRTFLNALREKVKGMFERKGSITNDDFDAAVKQARSSAGGKHSARKKKRSDEGGVVANIDGEDFRPKLAKDDAAVNFVVDGGESTLLNGDRCGSCRFFGFDSCRLVEGTIEAPDVCDLYRDRVEFGFKDPADFHKIASSRLGASGDPVRSEYAFVSPLSLAEVKDGEWIPYLPTPGSFESPRYGTIVITAERNRRFVENFRAAVYQEKLPIDAEHETKLSGAVAWVTNMRQNDDGSVDAQVDWTDRGRTLMEGDRFKYFSPEFFDEWKDPATGELYSDVAIGGALTTRPFFKEDALRPLVASEGGIDALLSDDGRAHFERKPEGGDMTTKKTELTKESIVATAAKALAASEGNTVSEEELAEKIRTELASPEGEGSGEGEGEGEGSKAKGSEEELKTASERITATEKENKKLREELVVTQGETKELKEAARSKRFGELVTGITPESKHKWFGDVAENTKMLSELADAVGEDSDVFKQVVKSHNAQAAQIAFGATLQEKGYAGVSDVDEGSVQSKVAVEARKIMSEQPDKFRTIEIARTHVWDSHPEWKEEAHRR